MKCNFGSSAISVLVVTTVLAGLWAESVDAQATIDRYRVTSSLAPGIFSSKAEAEAAQRAFSTEASILRQVGKNTDKDTTTYTYAAVPQTIEPVRGPESFRANFPPNFGLQSGPVFTSEAALTQAVVDAKVAASSLPPVCDPNVSDLIPWTHLLNWIFEPVYGLTDSKQILITWAFILNSDGSCGQQTGQFSTPPTLYRSYELACPDGYALNSQDTLCENLLTATITEVNLEYDLEPEECIGKPCNPFTGSEIMTFDDVDLPGIEFKRVWRSRVSSDTAYAGDPAQSPDSGRLPYGWAHSYGQRILFDESGSPQALYRPNATRIPVEETVPGIWFAVNGSELQLRQTSADQWMAYLSDGSTEMYGTSSDAACPAGVVRLESITDSDGRSTTVEYIDACVQSPDLIRGPFGHTLEIQYQLLVDAVTPRSISALVDNAGRQVNFNYTLFSLPGTPPLQVLESVQYQDDSIETYHYESQQFPRYITGVTDENGIRYSTISYDAAGRTSTATLANGFNSSTFEYRTNGETNVTDARGFKSIYIVQDSDFDGSADRRVTIRNSRIIKDVRNDDTGQQRRTSVTDSNFLTTSYQFDDLHMTSMQVSGPNDSRSFEFEYLNDTSDLRTIERSPSSCNDGSTTPRQVETETTYTQGSQRISSVTERGYSLDESGACVAIERTTTYSNYNSFGQAELIDGPRLDVQDTMIVSYNLCTIGAGCGRPAYIENALGHRWTFDEYDAVGNLRRMTRPDGVETEYQYDPRNRVVAHIETSPNSTDVRTRTFAWYANGQLQRKTEPSGATFDYTYDDARNLRELTDAEGNRAVYDYDLIGNRTLEQYFDSAGVERFRRTRSFDSFNHLESETVPSTSGGADAEWSWVSDATGLLESRLDPLNNATEYLDYDDFRNLTVSQDASNGLTTASFDDNDNLDSTESANGSITQFEYDDFGRATMESSPDRGTTVYTYDEADNRISELDARGFVTTYEYDALNRLTVMAFSDGTSVTYEYDTGANGIGRLGRITDATGSTAWDYDPFASVAQKTSTIGGITLTSSFAYDDRGRLVKTTLPSGREIDRTYGLYQVASISVDGEAILSGATYEPFGTVNGWTWGDGQQATRAFSLSGLMTSFSLAGDTRTLSYDDAGRLIDITDNRGQQTFGYDALGRLTSFDPGSQTQETSGFASPPVLLTSIQTMNNEIGAVPMEPSSPWLTVATKNVSATGARIALERGQVNSGAIVNKEKIGYVGISPGSGGSFLDAQGNTILFEVQTTPEFVMGWDTGCFETAFLNQYASKPVVMASLQTRNGGDGGWLRRCRLNKTVLGLTVDEDKFGDSERRHNNAESAGIVAFSAAFDTQFTDSSGTWGMEIAKVTLPSTKTNPQFTSIAFRQSYATKPVVVVLPNKSGNNPASLRIRNVTRNGFEIVQVEPAPSNGTHNSMPIHYLAIETGSHTLPDGTVLEVGRKSTRKQKHGAGVIGDEGWASISFGGGIAGPELTAQAFGYDGNGNRTSLTENGTQYLYSNLAGSNRLLSAAGPVPKTYSYDPAGNVISDGVFTFGYDARGRLVDVDSGAASYQFNGMGQRIRKDAADTALFHYDESGRLIGEYDVLGAPLRETVWFNGEPVAVLRNGDTFFVHSDHLGTPRAITSGGTVVWRWESDPFGTTQAQEDPDGDGTLFAYNLRFPGQFYDSESGLHYNYLRTYDPATGRFLESDPIGLAGGSNTFAYVGGNPLTYFDLFGLDIYRFPGNVYTDRPATTASGSGCETPIWSGGYIVGWTECEKEIEDEVCPASSTPPPPPPRRAETGEDSPGDAEPATDIADDAISTAQSDYQVCLANALNDGLAAAGATIPPTVAALILLRRFGFSRRTTAIVGGELAAADVAFATAYGVGSVQKCRTERERAYGL